MGISIHYHGSWIKDVVPVVVPLPNSPKLLYPVAQRVSSVLRYIVPKLETDMLNLIVLNFY